MKKYIFRVIFKLGFALIIIALKQSRKKDDLEHLHEFESMVYELPNITEAICQNDPCILIETNGPDICDYIHVHFQNALKEEQTNHGKMR